tara:strand:- start:4943 stop:5596 length:654 start_codon:yes stop_codon:yes gene_type:complete
MVMKKNGKHSGRKLITRSKLTERSLARSSKTGRVNGYESLHQTNWGLALDWDRKVADFYEEPIKLTIPDAGSTFKYYPDFEVVNTDGFIDYVEIKPFRYAIKPKTILKHELIGEHLNEQGYGFRVLTEKDLGLTQIQISNMRRLRWFAISGVTPLSELKSLAPQGSTTVEELERQSGSREQVMELLGRQLAFVDLSQPVMANTTIRKIKECDYVDFY